MRYPLEEAQIYRDALRKRFRRRQRKAQKIGKELVTTLEVEAAFRTLNNVLKTARKTFRRLERLEAIEDAVVNKGDKIAGRNRLHLAWGKE